MAGTGGRARDEVCRRNLGGGQALNSVGAHLRVCGLVQGVGYRYFCLRKALSLQLTGWVRNESDGSVSVLVEGDRGAIEALIED
ncbi:MAG: acylphosphatase, partial [Chitinivibrionia bacterium]|nr:acylphosphatase [Chitinivibrionia bacterium]